MFKFVDTLTDPKPWIKHFESQADATTSWKPGKLDSVVILQSEAREQGIDGPDKVQTISPIEQATSQAESGLIKDLQKSSQQQQPTKKRSGKSLAKGAATKITKTTQDILQREGRVSEPAPKKKKKKQVPQKKEAEHSTTTVGNPHTWF